MDEDNRYVKSHVKAVSHDVSNTDEGDGEWNYAEEAWGQHPLVVSSEVILHDEGLRAALEEMGGLPWTGRATVRMGMPKLPADGGASLPTFFPPSFTRDNVTTWIIGFEGFYVDPDTRYRVVTIHIAAAEPVEQLRDLPTPLVTFVERWYVVKESHVNFWLEHGDQHE